MGGLNGRLETAEGRLGKLWKRAKEMIHSTEPREGDKNTDQSVKQSGRRMSKQRTDNT